jgi:hypothetical protein
LGSAMSGLPALIKKTVFYNKFLLRSDLE